MEQYDKAYKACAFCGEQIPANDSRCKFCGSLLNIAIEETDSIVSGDPSAINTTLNNMPGDNTPVINMPADSIQESNQPNYNPQDGNQPDNGPQSNNRNNNGPQAGYLPYYGYGQQPGYPQPGSQQGYNQQPVNGYNGYHTAYNPGQGSIPAGRLSNGMKVLLTTLFIIIPGIGQLAGIITAIIMMNNDENADTKSFGVALLVVSLVMFVLSGLFFLILILALAISQQNFIY